MENARQTAYRLSQTCENRPGVKPVYCSRVNFTAHTVSNHINLSNGNTSQITWGTWKTIPVKSLFISIQCRTCGLIARLRLIIYIELNQYWRVVWGINSLRGRFAIEHDTKGRACLIHVWTLSERGPLSSLHDHSIPTDPSSAGKKTLSLNDHMQESVPMCEIGTGPASVLYPLIHPNVYHLAEKSKMSLHSHSSRCFGH